MLCCLAPTIISKEIEKARGKGDISLAGGTGKTLSGRLNSSHKAVGCDPGQPITTMFYSVRGSAHHAHVPARVGPEETDMPEHWSP
jgi:hypothetical protein